MKPAKIGGVMAAMEPARAQDLTVLLAKRLKVSQAAAVAPQAPSGPVAAEAPPATDAPAAVDATPAEPAPEGAAQPNG
jgi:flagellar motility protein MotE (MotC chaperone)